LSKINFFKNQKIDQKQNQTKYQVLSAKNRQGIEYSPLPSKAVDGLK
jgi:hypothetical protein